MFFGCVCFVGFSFYLQQRGWLPKTKLSAVVYLPTVARCHGRFAATYGDLAGCLQLSDATHVVTTPSVLGQCDAGPVALHCLEVSPVPPSCTTLVYHPRVLPWYHHPLAPSSRTTLVYHSRVPPSCATLVCYPGTTTLSRLLLVPPSCTTLVRNPLALAPPAHHYCSIIEFSPASLYSTPVTVQSCISLL